MRGERTELEGKYWKQFRAMEGRVEKMRGEIREHDKAIAGKIDQEKVQRNVKIDNTLKAKHGELKEKS